HKMGFAVIEARVMLGNRAVARSHFSQRGGILEGSRLNRVRVYAWNPLNIPRAFAAVRRSPRQVLAEAGSRPERIVRTPGNVPRRREQTVGILPANEGND